jgi:hypothetical protein
VAPEPVWTTWRSENSCRYRDSNSELLVDQPVARRYTDCAIPALWDQYFKDITSPTTIGSQTVCTLQAYGDMWYCSREEQRLKCLKVKCCGKQLYLREIG